MEKLNKVDMQKSTVLERADIIKTEFRKLRDAALAGYGIYGDETKMLTPHEIEELKKFFKYLKQDCDFLDERITPKEIKPAKPTIGYFDPTSRCL